MKYVLLFASNDSANAVSPEEYAPVSDQVMQWWGRHSQAGTILHGERLQTPDTATTLRAGTGAGAPVTTDGPYVESKEVLGGYGLIEVADLDEALALAATWPLLTLPGQSVEVRPIVEM